MLIAVILSDTKELLEVRSGSAASEENAANPDDMELGQPGRGQKLRIFEGFSLYIV